MDSRLYSRYATQDEYLLVFIFEQNWIGISAVTILIDVKSTMRTVSIVTGTPQPGPADVSLAALARLLAELAGQ